MTVGLISSHVLTDIANAIRQQNSTSTLYAPGDMAAVSALDGTSAGAPGAEAYKAYDQGAIDDSVFSGIAGAIRGQNGLAVTYTPAEMAPAILALVWDVGVKLRAMLLSDGTLEFNYRDGRSTDTYLAIVKCWEVDPAGYSGPNARPWDADKPSVTRMMFSSDIAGSGLASTAYFFHGMTELVYVSGFEALSGIKTMGQMFTSCSKLESIFASSFDNSGVSAASAFYGCTRLVSGTGFVPTTSSGATVLKFGAGGVLTSYADDQRTWCRCHLYADGELVVTAEALPEAGREVLSSGNMCTNALYNAVGATPWYDERLSVTQVTFASDITLFEHTNLNYWFYGHTAIAFVAGMGNLRGTKEMRYAFSTRSALLSLDLRGFDPATLTNLSYTFSSCKAMTTILVDPDWELPLAGVTLSQTFFGCNSLVGGNGTSWVNSATSGSYMRIDAPGAPGYLTAG